MKTKTIILSASFMLLFISVISAQQTTQEITDKFFQSYKTSPKKAVNYAFSTNKWFSGNQAAITELENKLNKLISIVGEYYGYEKICEKKIGENYKLENYMMKYDRQPVKFTFIFYRPDKVWHIQNFYFNTDFDNDIENKAKGNMN